MATNGIFVFPTFFSFRYDYVNVMDEHASGKSVETVDRRLVVVHSNRLHEFSFCGTKFGIRQKRGG